jgi:hypothetical protein
MAHKVTFSLPTRELGSADIVVQVKRGGNTMFGTLRVSKGGIAWFPKNTKTKGWHHGWSKFAQRMAPRPKTQAK